MKTLLIMRHAKSSWDDDSLPDHLRPLNKRGQRDAPRMGRLLARQDLKPDRILSSTAVRARTTAEIVAAELEFAGEIQLRPDLYHADPEDYLQALAELGDGVNRVLVIGHNPGMEELIAELTEAAESFPTAAIAVVEIPIEDWRELNPETQGRLIDLYRPKDL
jgi:phosphohistidine phosphatase